MSAPSGSLAHAAHRLGLGLLEDVVAEADHEALAAGEALGHAHDLGDPAGLGLHLVGQVQVEEEAVAVALPHAAVAEQVDEVAGMPLPGDDEHVPDPERAA